MCLLYKRSRAATPSSERLVLAGKTLALAIIILTFQLQISFIISTAGNKKPRENVLYAKHSSGGRSILISLQQRPSDFHQLLTLGRDNTKTVRRVDVMDGTISLMGTQFNIFYTGWKKQPMGSCSRHTSPFPLAPNGPPSLVSTCTNKLNAVVVTGPREENEKAPSNHVYTISQDL